MLIIYRLCLHNHLHLLYVKTFHHSVDMRINYIRCELIFNMLGGMSIPNRNFFLVILEKGVAPMSLPKHGLLKINFPHNRL